MRNGFILLAAATILTSGCATVDLQNMAGSSTVEATSQNEAETNVVQRAVAHLRDAFISRGFGAKSSKKKMQAAADMLLNGLSAQSVSTTDGEYAASSKTTAMILDDIQIAQGHVEQTMRAAEIYLEVAPLGRKLDDELQSLEAALLASERAVQTFDDIGNDELRDDIEALETSVDGLRRVTDAFGARVRMSNSDKLAVDAASRVG